MVLPVASCIAGRTFATSSPLFRVVDEDLSAGSALLTPRGDEELAQRSREESRLRAEARRLRAHLLIVVEILLPDDL